jgi:fluoride exporter
MAYLLVFIGAGLGGALRHGTNIACERLCGTTFPWGTLTVNVLGSLLMGVLAGWLAVKAGAAWSQPVRLFLATGVLGGYTTFSAFSLDVAVLYHRGELALAALYALGSVVLSIAALFLGLFIARAL